MLERLEISGHSAAQLHFSDCCEISNMAPSLIVHVLPSVPACSRLTASTNLRNISASASSLFGHEAMRAEWLQRRRGDGVGRRQQSLAVGHSYATPLMSGHHIRWDPPQHPCCWMPFSLYVGWNNHNTADLKHGSQPVCLVDSGVKWRWNRVNVFWLQGKCFFWLCLTVFFFQVCH